MAKTNQLSEAHYSISQVNALTGVPKTTIRFWEKEFKEFLRPLRTDGNQRRYDHGNVEIITKINRLVNDEGYTLEGVRKRLLVADDPKTAATSIPERKIENLADTMSDYLLRKIFAMAQTEEVSNL